ncbi:hypothetical protein [Paenibacillus donghaensis]|uniref:Uncharacterized protein n=1 Tax=Paenibacillus donghaensis TaxID=414771 RepID=A0A2Z2KIY7_9BACL|nr:hypothetical protein [Paenibacillus donghaensis]ASA23220.1 hypothetical protein B9T62_21870 [Paenibacillus donghaensis]
MVEMEPQELRAKELYCRYLGHLPAMHRGGVLAEYQSYGVSEEQEQEWLQNIMNTCFGQLSIRDWEAVSSLADLSVSCTNNLIVEKTAAFAARNIASGDSVVRLMYAERLVEIIRLHKQLLPREQLFDACRTAVQVLEGVISQPLILDPGHELKQLVLRDKRALNLRAAASLETIKLLIN